MSEEHYTDEQGNVVTRKVGAESPEVAGLEAKRGGRRTRSSSMLPSQRHNGLRRGSSGICLSPRRPFLTATVPDSA